MEYPVNTLSQLRSILQGLRKANKLTQTALAQKLGVSQQSYAQLEANPTSASIDRLCKVLEVLNVDLVLRDGVCDQLSILGNVATVGRNVGVNGLQEPLH
ncbi:helix-turn-helix domain-containing protein [Glaciimonas soli]|uniref:Helix-turn-helix domain-containing protein n=1 Tax=Glaciimonas soli TaxID=2590999 RepID=A0A843YTN0_9BURK|nr:helix-turn-helix transcriptional regulator [Glaciimonas soli]MQR00858.1 helix-turn-helix domain-containing protein [Glaciimonas soli]